MIKIKQVYIAGGACPYQIEALTDDEKYFYLRYRNGTLRYGVWDSPSRCDHANYNFTQKIGGPYSGYPDHELFSKVLDGYVQFPNGFEHGYASVDGNFSDLDKWNEFEGEAAEKLKKLFYPET